MFAPCRSAFMVCFKVTRFSFFVSSTPKSLDQTCAELHGILSHARPRIIYDYGPVTGSLIHLAYIHRVALLLFSDVLFPHRYTNRVAMGSLLDCSCEESCDKFLYTSAPQSSQNFSAGNISRSQILSGLSNSFL